MNQNVLNQEIRPVQAENRPPAPAAQREQRRQHFNSAFISFARIPVPTLEPGLLSNDAVNYLVNEISQSMYKENRYSTLVDRSIAAGMLAARNADLIRPNLSDRTGLVSKTDYNFQQLKIIIEPCSLLIVYHSRTH